MPRRTTPLIVALTTTAVLAPTLANVPTAHASGQDTLVGYLGMCLGEAGGRGTARPATMQECTGGAAQSWEYLSATQQLRLKGTTRCLNASGGGTANGTPLILWPCGNPAYPNEQWQRERVYDGQVADDTRFRLRGVASGRCVDVANPTHVPGTQVTLLDCADTPADLWFSAWGLLLDIPLHVYAATNNDGTSLAVGADMAATVADANVVMARAGVRYVWDNQITYRPVERLNSPGLGAGSVELDRELRRIASEDGRRMTVVLKDPSGGWSGMSQRSPGLEVWSDYVTMPSHASVNIWAGQSWDEDLTGWMLLHEGGHYLGLDHTAPIGGRIDQPWTWETDQLQDTPPDPSIESFQAVWSLVNHTGEARKHECDDAPGSERDALYINGVLRANPEKGNAMGYYACKRPVRYTPQQISKMRASLWNYASRMALFAPVIERAPVVDVATAVVPGGYRLYTARGDGTLEVRASATAGWAAATPTVIGLFNRPIRVGAVTHGGLESVLVTAADTGQMWIGWPSGGGYAWQEWTATLPEPVLEAVGTSNSTGQVFALGRSGTVYVRWKQTSAVSAAWSGWVALPPSTLDTIAVANQAGSTYLVGLTRSGDWTRLVRWTPGAPTWTPIGKTWVSPAAPNPYALTVAMRSDQTPQLAIAGSGDDIFLPLGQGSLSATRITNDQTSVSSRVPTQVAGETFSFGALDLASIIFSDNSVQVIYAYPVGDLRTATLTNGVLSNVTTVP